MFMMTQVKSDINRIVKQISIDKSTNLAENCDTACNFVFARVTTKRTLKINRFMEDIIKTMMQSVSLSNSPSSD
jgi:hypothetical protein